MYVMFKLCDTVQFRAVDKKLDHVLLVASILCIWQIDAKKDAIKVVKKELKDAKSDYKAKHSESARG